MIPAIARLVPVFGDIGSVGVVYLADIALGLPVALLLRIDLRFPSAAAWPALLAAGLFESAGFACVAAGSRLAPIALVSPLASLASAFTVLYAWTVLRERPARAGPRRRRPGLRRRRRAGAVGARQLGPLRQPVAHRSPVSVRWR